MEYGFSSFMIDKAPPPFVNELRIGNWISSYMAFMDDKEFSHKEIRKMQVDGELMKYLIDNPMSTFKGILLSSDILEKCGFKSEVGYYSGDVGPYQLNFYHTGNNWYLGEIGKALWERENGINFSEKQIQYLHTLQNLLHSLGEILTVSL